MDLIKRMSGLVAVIMLFGLQFNYLAAIEQVGFPDGQSSTFSGEEGSKIILIGYGNTDEPMEFALQVYKEAIKKNIVALAEGYQDRFDNDFGYLFGMEHALPYLSLDDNEWFDLFKYFGLYILENHVAKLSEDQQLDIEKKCNFCSEEPTKSKNIGCIRNDVNTYWRNSFIKSNIKKAFTFAKQVKKSLFIVVTLQHFDDLESLIKSEGYPIERYPLEGLVDVDFLTLERARAALELEKAAKSEF